MVSKETLVYQETREMDDQACLADPAQWEKKENLEDLVWTDSKETLEAKVTFGILFRSHSKFISHSMDYLFAIKYLQYFSKK